MVLNVEPAANKHVVPNKQNDTPLLKAENLGVYRSGRWLIKDVNLSVSRGEIVTLIGPNGAGKSTCVKTILNLIKKDEGHIHFAKDIKTAYVPQRLNIDWTLPLTVARFISLTDTYKRTDIIASLEDVEIAHLIDRDIQSLSGGEFQRTLLARALIRKPDLLFLDEPFQGVDFSGEIALYQLVSKIRKKLDCGILLISHNLHIVMADTDHVVCLNKHVCCSGPPKVVTQNSEYQRLFGPHAAGVLAVYKHDPEHDHAHKHESDL